MIVQAYVWLALGLAVGLCGGFPWGRWNGRRALDRAEHRGWQGALEYCGVRLPGDGDDPDYDYSTRAEVMPSEAVVEPGNAPEGLVSLAAEAMPSLPGGDWRGQIAAELAPEALANQVPLPSVDEGLQRDVPEPGRDGPLSAGFGHPSPYAGVLTPAQRRRDKHKHRGQYAPQPGWTLEEANILSPHWKPEGDRWVAEWRIEWQDDVAAVDEEIAGWVERQRGWLAADRWDRGARRLGAVA